MALSVSASADFLSSTSSIAVSFLLFFLQELSKCRASYFAYRLCLPTLASINPTIWAKSAYVNIKLWIAFKIYADLMVRLCCLRAR
jgi:hypothetical protein